MNVDGVLLLLADGRHGCWKTVDSSNGGGGGGDGGGNDDNDDDDDVGYGWWQWQRTRRNPFWKPLS